jgi:3-hydroxyacyl-CoA dehydrogenase/enoyl-CoA hydratase/3-hydroxybutyryl-CoA epimerase
LDFTMRPAPTASPHHLGRAGQVHERDELRGLAELDGLIDRALADDAVKGAVITSAKRDSPAAWTSRCWPDEGRWPATTRPRLFDFVMKLHGILRKIERGGADPKTGKGGKPFACGLPGTAMGIGLEIGLACHRRFAADNAKAQDRPAGDHGRPLPRRRRHHAADAHARRDGRRALLLEGKTPDPKGAKAG